MKLSIIKHHKQPTSQAKKDRFRGIILLTIGFLLLLPVIAMGWYARPLADDFSYSLLTHQAIIDGKGLWGILTAAWETNLNFYYSWQGLYTTAFLQSLSPNIFGLWVYRITPTLILLLCAVPLFITLRIIDRHTIKEPTLNSVGYTTFILGLLISWIPYPNEGLYWYGSAINYTPWIFWGIAAAALVIEAVFHDDWKRNLLLMVSSLIAFFMSGTAHVSSFFCLLLVCYTTLCVMFSKRRTLAALLPFICSCAGFILMYTAPGTSVRQSIEQQQSVLQTIKAVFIGAINLSPSLFTLQWLVSLILVLTIGLKMIRCIPKEKLPSKFPLFPIIFSCVLFCGMMAVPWFSMGNFGQGRCYNMYYLSFMLLTWADAVLILAWLIKNDFVHQGPIQIHGAHTILTIICLIVFLFFPTSSEQFVFSGRQWSLQYRCLEDYHYGRSMNDAANMDNFLLSLENSTSKDVEISFSTIDRDSLLYCRNLAWNFTDVGKYYGKSIKRIESTKNNGPMLSLVETK